MGISFPISVWKPWEMWRPPNGQSEGVLMDVTIEKVGRKTRIKTATAHPTWVSRTPKGTYSPEGYDLYKYQTYILEDFIQGGKYRDKLDERDQGERDTAYREMKNMFTWIGLRVERNRVWKEM